MISPASRLANFQYAIRHVVDAAERLESEGRSVTYLNIGDPQAFGFRPPEYIVEPVCRALRDGFTGYSNSAGLYEAREAIADYATGLGVPTTRSDVLVTAGASEAADLTLSALLNLGEEVLLPAPGYPIYPALLSKLGAVAHHYSLNAETGWQPSVEQVRSLITKRTRALVLINPNNPTGAVTADETTARLLELAAENNLLVISDEVYRDLCFGAPPISASVMAQEIGVPLVTLESLSKTHLVPGWRVGWMRFTKGDKMGDLIGTITRLASGRLCSPTPAQYAVRPALEGDRTFLDEFIAEIQARRDLAVSQVRSIEGLSCTNPDAAFYLMVRAENLGGRTDEEFVLEMLNETGVLAVHGSGFGCDPRAGYFRLVYLAPSEILNLAISEMGRFVQASEVQAELASV